MADAARPARTLKDALDDVRTREPELTVQKLAKLAGVAAAAVIAAKKGEWPGQDKWSAEDHIISKKPIRQQVGWAETVTRLMVFVNRRLGTGNQLEWQDTLRQFGLDPDVPALAAAAKSVVSQSGSEGLATDSVLRQIALRKNVVKIGLLQWPPFFKYGEAARSSWAWRYSSRLVGSINPIDWELDAVEEASFDQAVTRLGAGSSELDLVFGVYDTPYRRMRGLDFVNIPGLAVPLGLISDRNDDSDLWRTIIDPQHPAREDLVILVLEGEVGHLFLRGPCQLSGKQQLQFIDYDGKGDLSGVVEQFRRSLEANPDGTVLICADRAFCRSVETAARRLVGSTDANLSLLATSLHVLEHDPILTPKYRLGLGVRADADRWTTLLREAQVSELFGNALGQTASEYVSLLLETKGEIVLVPLTPSLDEMSARSFWQQCSELLAKQRGDALFKHRHDQIDYFYNQIRRAWGGEDEVYEWKGTKLGYVAEPKSNADIEKGPDQ